MQTNGTPRRPGPFVPGSLLEFLMEFVTAFSPGSVQDVPGRPAAPAAPEPAPSEPAPPAPAPRAGRRLRAVRRPG